MTEDQQVELGRRLADGAKDYVVRAYGELSARMIGFADQLKAFEQRVASIKDGRDGEKGDPGRPADESAVHDLRAQVNALSAELIELKRVPPQDPVDVQAIARMVLAEIPRPKDGTSVTVDDVLPLISVAITKEVALIPRPKDGDQGPPGEPGEPGRSVDPADVETLVRKAVDEIPRPKDGVSVTSADVEPLIAAEVIKAVSAIPPAKDGVSVSSAVIDRDGHLVLTFSDGSTKELGIVVGRDADPGVMKQHVERVLEAWPRPKDGKDGKDAIGPDDVEEEYEDDGRILVRRWMRDGQVVKELRHTTKQPVPRDTYKFDRDYLHGDLVAWDGGWWITVVDHPKGQPGVSPEWKLVAMRGKTGAKGPQGPQGLRGSEGPQGPMGGKW